VLREDNVKATLSLSQRSVAFFKRAARQRRVPYQRMIRALVDAYAEKQEGKGFGSPAEPAAGHEFHYAPSGHAAIIVIDTAPNDWSHDVRREENT
jgi:hypothetical protein